MKDVGETVVNDTFEDVRIIVGDRIIDNDELEWREIEDGGRELTLNEIYNQIRTPLIYVWVETGLSGTIYECGNYEDGKWYEHGTTKGYA